MSEMIDRVLEAISPWLDHANERLLVSEAARAAIEAMREPTEAMLDAAEVDDGRGGNVDYVLATKIWRAMIDAALSEEGK